MKESSAWIKTHSLGVSMSADNPNVGTRKFESPIWSGGAQSDKLKVKLRQGAGTKALSCKHLFEGVREWRLCRYDERRWKSHHPHSDNVSLHIFNHHRCKYILKERTSKREQGVVAKVL